jgi:hypothetical protein
VADRPHDVSHFPREGTQLSTLGAVLRSRFEPPQGSADLDLLIGMLDRVELRREASKD